MTEIKQAALVLEDGTLFDGELIGYEPDQGYASGDLEKDNFATRLFEQSGFASAPASLGLIIKDEFHFMKCTFHEKHEQSTNRSLRVLFEAR